MSSDESKWGGSGSGSSRDPPRGKAEEDPRDYISVIHKFLGMGSSPQSGLTVVLPDTSIPSPSPAALKAAAASPQLPSPPVGPPAANPAKALPPQMQPGASVPSAAAQQAPAVAADAVGAEVGRATWTLLHTLAA